MRHSICLFSLKSNISSNLSRYIVRYILILVTSSTRVSCLNHNQTLHTLLVNQKDSVKYMFILGHYTYFLYFFVILKRVNKSFILGTGHIYIYHIYIYIYIYIYIKHLYQLVFSGLPSDGTIAASV